MTLTRPPYCWVLFVHSCIRSYTIKKYNAVLRAPTSDHPLVLLQIFHLNEKAMHLFLPTYCSTVAQREENETNCYGCSALWIFFIFFYLVLPYCVNIQCSSDFLIFLFMSFQIFDMNSVLLLFSVSRKQCPSVCSTLFSHMEVYHWVLPGYVSPEWDELKSLKKKKGVHICILAYLWFSLRHVDECCIANRKF